MAANGIDDHAADSKDGRLCGSLRCGPRRGLRRKRESKKKQNLQEVQRKHGSVSHLQQLKLDFFLLIRTNRQVASMRKVSAHGFRIPVFELLDTVNGENLVCTGCEKRQGKRAFRIGGLNDWRIGRVVRKSKNNGTRRFIVQGDVSTERRAVITKGDFDGLRRTASGNRQIGFEKIERHTGNQRMPLGVLRVCEKSVGTGRNTRDAKRASRRIESWIGGEMSPDRVGNLEIDVLA